MPNAQMLQYYIADMGPAYGAFTYGNSHFIALNSEAHAHRGPTGTCSSDQAAKKPIIWPENL